MLSRLIALALLLGGASMAGVATFVYLHEEPEPAPQSAAIIVLSGPGAELPGLEGETRDRVEHALTLFAAGAAPRIVMTGSGVGADGAGTTHAEHMGAYASERGVPDEAILEERDAGSTLQNALFTAGLVDPTAPVILVTQRYHLPRAWASFRWAGFEDIILAAPDSGGIEITPSLLMEAVKWPVNLVRAAGASLAIALGAEEEQVIPWLK